MTAVASTMTPNRDITQVRILRLATGTSLALAFSQAVNWNSSFITPVLVSVILGLPLPAPSFAGGTRFVAALVAALIVGLALLPALLYQPGAGVLLVNLALFGCFFYGARGGSSIIIAFLLMGLTLVPAIGSESVDGALSITRGLAIGSCVAMLFVWLSYAIFPDPEIVARPGAKPAAKPAPPSVTEAGRSALRSTLIVTPVLLWFLMASGTSGYAAVLIKVASMGQQVSGQAARAAGRSLILSTLIGGAAASVIWWVLKIWPNLLIYSLLFLMCGLLIGPRIFAGKSFAPTGPMWSYGFLTMIVIIAPAVTDSQGGDDAGTRFTDRIIMFILATLYAVIAVNVFDRLWPAKKDESQKST
jgi:uncharacterized membrane protein YccC